MRKILIRALASLMSDSDVERRVDMLDSDYSKYLPEQKTFIKGVYENGYDHGIDAVADDIFTNTDTITFNEVRDRFSEYTKVANSDWDFIRKVADGDKKALRDILKKSGQPGFRNDFDYDIYSKYYIDGSLKTEINEDIGIEPHTQTYIADMGYYDGVGRRVWYLAEESLQDQARELLEESMQEDLADVG